MNQNNLIITADDFGLCNSVNDAIIDSFDNNNITNTSILANMPNIQKNAELLKKSKLNYGLHFSLNRGIPFNRKSSLCDSDGNFYSRKKLFKQIILGKVKVDDILSEFKHQLKICAENNLVITHFDSDNHVHFHPFIFSAIFKNIIEKKLSFRSLNPLFYNLTDIKRFLRQVIFFATNKTFDKINKKRVFSNNFFCSPYDYQDTFYLSESLYINIMKNIKGYGTTELMVHPYYESNELRKHYPFIESRNFLNNCFVEANILTSKRNLFNIYDIHLSNFQDLRKEFLKSL
jgi:predicted glycoside hydrolase/deacetylase ChbG (UPF0249 family)